MPLRNEAKFHEHDGKYILDDELLYFSNRFNKVIIVPAGSAPSDLASVPSIFRALVKTSGRITYASIVHDWLYKTRGAEDYVTRKQADQIFLDIMEERGLPLIRRRMAYRGVRMNILSSDGWWYEEV